MSAREPTVIYEDKQITTECFPLQHRISTWGYLFREKPKPLNIRKDMIRLYQIPLHDIPGIKSGNDYVTADGKIIPYSRLTHPPVKPRSYAYCSDTVYSEQLPQFVGSVDLLYHEATYGNDGKERSKETFHSTAEDAARIAEAGGAGKLVIGHFSARYKDITPLLEEARSIFKNTEDAEDGRVFEIEQKRRPEQ